MVDDTPKLHLEQSAAEEMAANAVIKYLHGCGVEGDQKKRQWIERVFDRVRTRELNH